MTHIIKLLMNKNSFISVTIILVLFYGCVTANITSNKAEWYNEKLNRVYIFLNTV